MGTPKGGLTTGLFLVIAIFLGTSNAYNWHAMETHTAKSYLLPWWIPLTHSYIPTMKAWEPEANYTCLDPSKIPQPAGGFRINYKRHERRHKKKPTPTPYQPPPLPHFELGDKEVLVPEIENSTLVAGPIPPPARPPPTKTTQSVKDQDEEFAQGLKDAWRHFVREVNADRARLKYMEDNERVRWEHNGKVQEAWENFLRLEGQHTSENEYMDLGREGFEMKEAVQWAKLRADGYRLARERFERVQMYHSQHSLDEALRITHEWHEFNKQTWHFGHNLRKYRAKRPDKLSFEMQQDFFRKIQKHRASVLRILQRTRDLYAAEINVHNGALNAAKEEFDKHGNHRPHDIGKRDHTDALGLKDDLLLDDEAAKELYENEKKKLLETQNGIGSGEHWIDVCSSEEW